LSGSIRSRIAGNKWLSPALKSITELRCKIWDVSHAVDTCGEIPLASLDFQGRNKREGLEYHSHHPRLTRTALAAVDVAHRNYTFIDFGCGKGRVILLASEFPYGKIVGLEFAPQLAATAQHNAQRYRSRSQKCHNIEVICTDVTEYKLPREPQVFYFYNPFTPDVMQRVGGAVDESLQESPRDAWAVLTGTVPARDRMFGTLRHFERLRRDRYFDICRHARCS
jgi:SAM-dependent methyltransferase